MYSENLLRETEKEMKEIDAKKRLDYVKGIALREKLILQAPNRVEPELTEEELAEIKDLEFKELNKDSTVKLRSQRKRMKLMELNPV